MIALQFSQQSKHLDKNILFRCRTNYVQQVLESSKLLPGPMNYIVSICIAHYKDRKTGEYSKTFVDAEIRDCVGEYIPTDSIAAILEDFNILNNVIDLYGHNNGEVYDVKNYIDFEDAVNKQCKGGFEIESSGVVFLHMNKKQFDALSSIPSLTTINKLTEEDEENA
jgi:hypothetical protein